MIVNPGIRRFLGSAIQRLFNSASFYAPLTHSLVLERGTGSPNFTRATTATVRDNEGVLRTAIAGEARFEGARRVRNLLTFTEDLTNAVWAKTSVTASAGGFLETAVSSTHRVQQAIAKVAASAPFIGSVSVKPAGRNWCLVGITNTAETAYYFIYVNLLTGATGSALSAGFTSPAVTVAAESDGYYRISVKAITDAAANLNLYVYSSTGDGVVSFLGDITKGLSVARAQLEDVTAQTTQTAGEYVSVGVPSDWAGPEFISNGTFDTDTTGWTAGEILGGAAGTLSTNSGRLRITNTGTSYGAAYQTFTTVVGTRYVLSGSAYLGSNTLWAVRLGSTGFPSFDYGNPSSGSDGSISISFIATTTSTTLTLYGLNNPDAYVEFDNISVKPAYYHGSMVDGVKCFATDISGNPIPLTTLLGYQAQGARTNLVWPSEDLTHVRYVSGGGGIAVVADQAVAPDGTTTADQLTASGANGTLIQDLGVIASAAQTFSLYLKRKTGTGNIDITLDGGATWTTQTITTTEWTRCPITQTVANPDVGIRIVTSGDAIYAWGLQCE